MAAGTGEEPTVRPMIFVVDDDPAMILWKPFKAAELLSCARPFIARSAGGATARRASPEEGAP
jgi:hypothetical protein